jgi:hypothetical protein
MDLDEQTPQQLLGTVVDDALETRLKSLLHDALKSYGLSPPPAQTGGRRDTSQSQGEAQRGRAGSRPSRGRGRRGRAHSTRQPPAAAASPQPLPSAPSAPSGRGGRGKR